MSEEKPIKSPFQTRKLTTVRKATNSDEIVEIGWQGFATLLASLVEEGVSPAAETLTSYVAGFGIALKAMGFSDKDTENIGMQLHHRIVEIGTSGCGNCERCKKKKNES